MHSEIDRLRARDLGLARGDLASPCTPAFVGRVVSTSNGVASAHWVKVNPHRTTLGTESEGSTGSADVDTSTGQLVYLVGGTAATGDDLICHFVPWRWVGRKKTATTTITCNPCVPPPPTSLSGTLRSFNGVGTLATSSFTLAYSATNPLPSVFTNAGIGGTDPGNGNYWYADCIPLTDAGPTGSFATWRFKIVVACLSVSHPTRSFFLIADRYTGSPCTDPPESQELYQGYGGGVCAVGTCTSFFHVRADPTDCTQTNSRWEASQ